MNKIKILLLTITASIISLTHPIAVYGGLGFGVGKYITDNNLKGGFNATLDSDYTFKVHKKVGIALGGELTLLTQGTNIGAELKAYAYPHYIHRINKDLSLNVGVNFGVGFLGADGVGPSGVFHYSPTIGFKYKRIVTRLEIDPTTFHINGGPKIFKGVNIKFKAGYSF